MASKKNAQKSRKNAGKSPTKSNELKGRKEAAIIRRSRDLKVEAKVANKERIDRESDVFKKIAEMPKPDRFMAMQLHKMIQAIVPALSPKTWYGMPDYANKAGKVVCFFQSAQVFKTRYSLFGFTDAANLDAGAIWPVAFAL